MRITIEICNVFRPASRLLTGAYDGSGCNWECASFTAESAVEWWHHSRNASAGAGWTQSTDQAFNNISFGLVVYHRLPLMPSQISQTVPHSAPLRGYAKCDRSTVYIDRVRRGRSRSIPAIYLSVCHADTCGHLAAMAVTWQPRLLLSSFHLPAV